MRAAVEGRNPQSLGGSAPQNPAPNKKCSGAFPPKSTFWQPSPRTAYCGYDCIREGAGGKRDFGNLGGHQSNVTEHMHRTRLVLVETFDGELGVDPVLLAAGVVTDVGVTHGRQFTGGVLGGVSGRASAIDDDLGVFIREQRGSEGLDFVGRKIFCGWNVGM